MTDMTESTELLDFKRQKDGYKVDEKISLCIWVVLSWDELKVWQNLLASDHEIYTVCLLVATVYWRKSLQFVKKNLTEHSYFVYLWFHKTNKLFRLLYYALVLIFAGSPGFTLCFPLPHLYHKTVAIIDTNTNECLPCMKIFVYVELTILEYVLFVVTNICFRSSVAVKSGLLLQRH